MYQQSVRNPDGSAKLSTFDQEKAACLHSAIVAKAILKDGKGGVHIAVVFEKSARQEFYFTFAAKSARSPRKSWKLTGYFTRDARAYQDFGGFVAYFSNLRHASVMSVKVLRSKALTSMQTARIRESLIAKQVVQDVTKLSTSKVEEKYRRGRMGRTAIFSSWRS